MGTDAGSTSEIAQTYIQLSQLFSGISLQDSALFYARQAMQIAQNRNAKPLISWAANQLAHVYEFIDTKEALRYYKLSAAMKEASLVLKAKPKSKILRSVSLKGNVR